MKIETLALKASQMPDANAGAVAAPIYLSSTFERAEDGSFPHGHIYSRTSNPNRNVLEKVYALLEGGESAMAFASGQAATAALFQALKPDTHILLSDDSYHGTPAILQEVYGRWGLQFSKVNMCSLDAVEQAIRPNTAMIWMETPSNPLLKITDIEAITSLAKKRQILTVCDNTWATPVLQQPLALGCDVVMHSATKYFGGHSDLVSGALMFKNNDEFCQRVRQVQALMGGVPSPFDCWLIARGIKTLALRVRQQSANAMAVAEFLNQHPKVEKVNYPGLSNHIGHDIAKKQMSMFGAMLSVQIKGGAEAAMKAAANVQIFTRATSLGGVESLIEHRASVEGPHSLTPQNLLRISIGLEHHEDLIADLEQAL